MVPIQALLPERCRLEQSASLQHTLWIAGDLDIPSDDLELSSSQDSGPQAIMETHDVTSSSALALSLAGLDRARLRHAHSLEGGYRTCFRQTLRSFTSLGHGDGAGLFFDLYTSSADALVRPQRSGTCGCLARASAVQEVHRAHYTEVARGLACPWSDPAICPKETNIDKHLPPPEAGIHACLIREASQHARAVELTRDNLSLLAKGMAPRSAARAVARQQKRTMSALLATHTSLNDFFAVVGQQVALLDGLKWEGGQQQDPARCSAALDFGH